MATLPLMSLERASRYRALVAVALVVALSAAGGLAVLGSGQTDDPAPDVAVASATPSPPQPAPSVAPEALSNEEAVAEFRRLHELAYKLTRHRDSFFVVHVFTESGPMLERSRTRIQELIQDRVLDESEVRLLDVELRSAAEDRFKLLATSRTSPCFVTESGRDVTQDRSEVRDEVLWTMKWEAGRWKLHDAQLRDQKGLGSRDRACPDDG